MMVRDKKRWDKADLSGNGQLTLQEFNDFLHPEDVERMRDSVVDVCLSSSGSFSQFLPLSSAMLYGWSKASFVQQSTFEFSLILKHHLLYLI